MDEQFTGTNTAAKAVVSRRTLVKAAAWSAPVVALAVAAPAASASAKDVTALTVTSSMTSSNYASGLGTPIMTTPTAAASTVTYTTAKPHGLVAGDTVHINGLSVAGYNQTAPAAGNVASAPTSTTFTISNATTGTATFGSRAITAATGSTPTGYIVASFGAAHGLTVGQTVFIAGLTAASSGGFVVTQSNNTASAVGGLAAYSIKFYSGETGATSKIASFSVPIQTVTTNATTTTLTTGAHTFMPGQSVTISTVLPNTYQGTKTITAVTATTISFAGATNGNVTTAGTVTGAWITGGVATKVQTQYFWVGSSPSYIATTASWQDNVGPYDWNTESMKVVYQFAANNGNAGYVPEITLYKLADSDKTNAIATSSTLPSGASALADADVVTSDAGATWTVDGATPGASTFTSTSVNPVKVTFYSDLPYYVTAANSIVYLPRVGIKVRFAGPTSGFKIFTNSVAWSTPNRLTSVMTQSTAGTF